MRKTKAEVDKIKQKILDFCHELRTTQEVADHLGVRPQDANSYCNHLKRYNFLDCIKGKNKHNMDCFYYRTLIPVFKIVRLNESTLSQDERWKWNPFGFMGMQVKEHNLVTRTIKADNYAEHIKDSDKKRREKYKSDRVHVSGSTLHMAV